MKLFVKGMVSTVICGTVGYVMALDGITPADVALSSALIGGVAYLIGFVQGEDWGKGKGTPKLIETDSHRERDPS